ncbi:MAG: 1-acyl-sn-glycerol-3-phosphate acyltransferase [Alphaproteobacteria bacterium]|nr:1-acyl-sn-glycerol-3-phosphate acyltransferase [Alphaproteobacteria bacterium]
MIESVKKVSFWVSILIMTLGFSLVFYWMILLPGKKHLIWVSQQWIKGFFLLMRLVWNIRYQLQDIHHVPKNEAVIIASKHQSLIETFVFFNHIPEFSFILKRELLWIPIWGWWLGRTGRTIAIDRSSGVKALNKMLLMTEQFKQKKQAIIIYPEGTRGLPEQQLPLKGGAGAIYQKLQIPIVPVALNTGCFFPKKGKINSGIATIQFLPPIKAGLPKKEMMAQLADILHQESLKLLPK